MRFWTVGPIELERDDDGLFNYDADRRREFWEEVDAEHFDLSQGCGCYIFALRWGTSAKPWYVGKAENQNFRTESMSADNVTKYNDILRTQKGTPVMYFYARTTREKQAYSKPSRGKHRDIDYLEKMLIGQGLKRNKSLLNIRETALLRNMIVPGLLNTPKGAPRKSDLALKDLFRY